MIENDGGKMLPADESVYIQSPYQMVPDAGELLLAPSENGRMSVHWLAMLSYPDVPTEEAFLSPPLWASLVFNSGKRLLPLRKGARILRLPHPLRTVCIKCRAGFVFEERGASVIAREYGVNGHVPARFKSSVKGATALSGDFETLLLHDPRFFRDPEGVEERNILEVRLPDVVAWVCPEASPPKLLDGGIVLFSAGSVVYRRKDTAASAA